MIHHGFLNAVWLIRKVDVQSKNTESITCIEFIFVHYYGKELAINREIGDEGFHCVTNLIIEQSQFFSLTSTHPCTLSSAKKREWSIGHTFLSDGEKENWGCLARETDNERRKPLHTHRQQRVRNGARLLTNSSIALPRYKQRVG